MGKELTRLQVRKILSRTRAHLADGGDVSHLNITAMMDMMSILLVFLLKQFSVASAATTSSPQLVLPNSKAELKLQPAVNVTITTNAIIVEGDGVVSVRDGSVDASAKKEGANSYHITPLVDTLTKHANRLKKIQAMGGPVFDHTVLLLVDKSIPYRLVTEVLYSAGQAEFSNYRLVVRTTTE